MPASGDDDDDGAWLDPKWFVIGVALTAFGLILSYDLRLGIAAGALLGAAGLLWLYLALRFGFGPPTERSVWVERNRQQASNRRRADTRAAMPSDPQQRPDPTKRP